MQSTSEKSHEEEFVDDFFIFGYGSLIWNPGFEHNGTPLIGFVCEQARKFYQGSKNYRGTEECPGRVATLIPSINSRVWGLAYRVTQPESVIKTLEHLIEREMVAGEYQHVKVNFHPFKPAVGDNDFPLDVNTSICLCNNKSSMFNVLSYVADISNTQYLGPASISNQCYQISIASGTIGTNLEYVEKIAQFYIEQVPNGLEEDLYLKEIMENLDIFKSGKHDPENYLRKLGDSKYQSSYS